MSAPKRRAPPPVPVSAKPENAANTGEDDFDSIRGFKLGGGGPMGEPAARETGSNSASGSVSSADEHVLNTSASYDGLEARDVARSLPNEVHAGGPPTLQRPKSFLRAKDDSGNRRLSVLQGGLGGMAVHNDSFYGDDIAAAPSSDFGPFPSRRTVSGESRGSGITARTSRSRASSRGQSEHSLFQDEMARISRFTGYDEGTELERDSLHMMDKLLSPDGNNAASQALFRQSTSEHTAAGEQVGEAERVSNPVLADASMEIRPSTAEEPIKGLHMNMFEAFKAFDRDGSGLISKEELCQIVSDLGLKLTDKALERMIGDIDTDGDGQINYKEFVKAMRDGSARNLVASQDAAGDDEEMGGMGGNGDDESGNEGRDVDPMVRFREEMHKLNVDQRLERAAMYVKDAMKGRPCKLHRLHAGPMKVYRWIQQRHWEHWLQAAAVVYLLLAFFEAPSRGSLAKAYSLTRHSNNATTYSTAFACFDAGPATEGCFAVEGFLLIFIVIDEILKIYVYGPSDFFSFGMLQKHATVDSLAQAHIEVKRVEQIKALVALSFVTDYFLAAIPFWMGLEDPYPLTFRWSRWLRPVYMILTSRELRRWAQLIMASIPSTVGLAVLLFVVLSIYAIIGILIIGPKQMYENYPTVNGEQLYNNDENFSTYVNAMVVMYVLMTAENYPTITYAAYYKLGKWQGNIITALFFVSFMFVVTFFLANLALPRIYMEFRRFRDAAKRRARFLSRSAMLMCFAMLDFKRRGLVDYDTFSLLVKQVRPELEHMRPEACQEALETMFEKLCAFSMPIDSLTVEDVIRNPQQFLSVILTEFEDNFEEEEEELPSSGPMIKQASTKMQKQGCCGRVEGKMQSETPSLWKRFNNFRFKTREMLNTSLAQNCIMVMIVANTVCIACYSNPSADITDGDEREKFRESQYWIEMVVRVFMVIFVVEMILKLIAGGTANMSWSMTIECTIVFSAAAVEFVRLGLYKNNIEYKIDDDSEYDDEQLAENLEFATWDEVRNNVGKAIITLRLFRSVDYMDIPGVGNIKRDLSVIQRITPLLFFSAMIILMFSYSFAIAGMELFANHERVCVDGNGDSSSVIDQASLEENFSYMTEALKVLLQIMSNSNWQDPMYAALNEKSYASWDKAVCYAYFILYHFFATFLMMQIVVALYIEAFEQFHLIIQNKRELEIASARQLSNKHMNGSKGNRIGQLKQQVSTLSDSGRNKMTGESPLMQLAEMIEKNDEYAKAQQEKYKGKELDELSALAGTDLELVGVPSKGRAAVGELRAKSTSAADGGVGSQGLLGSAVTKRNPKKRPSAL